MVHGKETGHSFFYLSYPCPCRPSPVQAKLEERGEQAYCGRELGDLLLNLLGLVVLKRHRIGDNEQSVPNTQDDVHRSCGQPRQRAR